MEGTRNERVAILLASYLIGFITAYIAFGVVQLEETVKFVQVPVQNTASVIQSQQDTEVQGVTLVAVDKEGLVLIQDGERTLLSSKSEGDIDGDTQEGEHVAISYYSLSDDQSNVYFCELPSVDSESCRPYIYSIADQTVYPVMVNGQRVAFEAQGHEVAWSPDGQLLID